MLKNPMNACGRYPDVRMGRQQESCRRRTATGGGNYEETGMGLVNYSGAGGGARALSCDRTGLCDRSGWDPA